MVEYVRDKIITPEQVSAMRDAITGRLNIVISCGTEEGKTMLATIVITENEATSPADRSVILEDTAEIRCGEENAVAVHKTGAVDMAQMLKSTMRLRPDRIIVGEFRDVRS